MANGKIIQLNEAKDLDIPVYPVTKAEAVYLENGSSLNDYINLFKPKLIWGDILTPVMRSNTAPEGEAFCSHPYTSHQPYQAFDRMYGYNVSYYHSTDVVPQYIGYKFTSKVQVTSVRLTNGQTSSWTGRMPGTFYVQASNDGTNYINMGSFSKSGAYYQEIFHLSNAVSESNCYLYWRLYITASCTSDNYMNISGIDFYGYKLQ